MVIKEYLREQKILSQNVASFQIIHTVLLAILVGSIYTATESIVVVIVRIEANYRFTHVWPPYAYNFTYSYMY